MKNVPLHNKHLKLLVEGESGLLYVEQHHTLYQLPAIGISLLLALDLGFSEADCISQIHELSQLPPDLIKPVFDAIVMLYNGSQMDENSTQCKQVITPLLPENFREEHNNQYHDALYFEVIPHVLADKPFKSEPAANVLNHQSFSMALEHCGFVIDCEDKALRHAIKEHLNPIVLNLDVVSDLPIFLFEIRSTVLRQKNTEDNTSLRFNVFSSGQLLEANLTFSQVLPVIIERMQIISYQLTPFKFCFHGAALRLDNQLLLLPGKSGVGKSTLTGFLAAKGALVLSDEYIVFDEQFKIMSLPFPIAIKRGAWDVLSQHYPELSHRPEWQLKDGREVKYVWTKTIKTAAGQSCLKAQSHERSMVILPDFQPCKNLVHGGSEDNIDNLPSYEAVATLQLFEHLIIGGYQVGNQLDFCSVMELIEFFELSDNFKLSYANSEQAYQVINEKLCVQN